MQTELNRATIFCIKNILKKGGRITDFTTTIILFDCAGFKLCELNDSNLLELCQVLSLRSFQVESATSYVLAE